MVLDQIIFATALGGSIVASAYDLKTTEVPNWVFYAMMIVGIPAVILKFVLGGEFNVFAMSGLTGIGLFAFGFLMYKIGQWGGADMVLLALIGFMIPSVGFAFPGGIAFPFGVSLLFNVFMIGAGYMILYAIVFSLIHGKLLPKFVEDMKIYWKQFSLIILSVAVAFTLATLYIGSLIGASFTFVEISRNVLLSTSIIAVFLVIYKFARLVENFGFKKKIPVSKLKVGDMLMSERKLIGISDEQIRRIKKSGTKSVWIKEGVRFIPVFPMALLFTLYFGDVIFLISLFL